MRRFRRRRFGRRFRARRSYKARFIRRNRGTGRVPRPELKCVDILNESVSTPAAPNLACTNWTNGASGNCALLNTCGTGASFYHRIGRRINMKSVEIRWSFLPNGSAMNLLGGSERHRIMLVYDKQPNPTTQLPEASSLLTNVDPAGTATTLAGGMFNMTNRDRFLLIRDYGIIFNYFPGGATPIATLQAASTNVFSIADRVPGWKHWYIKLRGLESVYKADTGGLSDIQSGALYLIHYVSSTTPMFNLLASSRLRFYD